MYSVDSNVRMFVMKTTKMMMYFNCEKEIWEVQGWVMLERSVVISFRLNNGM